MPLRLLRYMVRIWDRWLEDHPGARALPPILPMVLYQGPRPWATPRQLADLVTLGRHPALADHVPDFAWTLTELATQPDDALGPPAQAITLRFMKYVRTRDLLARLRDLPYWVDELRALRRLPRGLPLLGTLVTYVLEATPSLDLEALMQTLDDVSRDLEEPFESIADLLRKQGFAAGRREGRQEGQRLGREEGQRLGRVEASREMLRRLLHRRFGALSTELAGC